MQLTTHNSQLTTHHNTRQQQTAGADSRSRQLRFLMESSLIARSKRRRLMVSSNVSLRPRPDLPACFELLNDDTKREILHFVGNKSYKSFGGINKQCREVYLNTPGMTKETFLFGFAPLSAIIDRYERGGRFNLKLQLLVGKGVVFYNRRDVMDWALEERNNDLLNLICEVAAVEEGRIDLLEEVWNNVNDENDIRYLIFRKVDVHAARGGKLNVLKWLCTKGLYIDKDWCAKKAAEGGHLHILKWLRKKKGFELDGNLYYSAIDGGHLHVMKWLREQEVDWGVCTFYDAAEEGYMNILQWLHDEGCPWPRGSDYLVHADGLQPEVIDWLRTNGYGDRIIM